MINRWNLESSAGYFWGRSKIVKDDELYMTRYWIGRLRLHIFYSPDPEDPHDHPWGFWTFPLTSYLEQYYTPHIDLASHTLPVVYVPRFNVVKALRLTYRPATYLHRVIGRHDNSRALTTEPQAKPGRVITIVWRENADRKWGFMKNRDGKWCWQFWKDYESGGKYTPCS